MMQCPPESEYMRANSNDSGVLVKRTTCVPQDPDFAAVLLFCVHVSSGTVLLFFACQSHGDRLMLSLVQFGNTLSAVQSRIGIMKQFLANDDVGGNLSIHNTVSKNTSMRVVGWHLRCHGQATEEWVLVYGCFCLSSAVCLSVSLSWCHIHINSHVRTTSQLSVSGKEFRTVTGVASLTHHSQLLCCCLCLLVGRERYQMMQHLMASRRP